MKDKRIGQKEWKKRNPGKMREYRKRCYEKYKNTQRYRDGKRRKNLNLKKKIINHYSQGSMKCSCGNCNENHIEFLTIDHINGGGTKHKKETKNHLYSWLIRNKYPTGFRVLCMNCNFAIGIYGYCPHVRQVK